MAREKAWVSQSEAARREGVSQQWIAKLVKQKRLEVNRKKQVRLAQVRTVRATELDPSRGRHKAKAPLPTALDVPPADPPPTSGFTAARTRREEQQATLAELEVRQRLGELVEWEKIEALNASTAVLIRESLLAVAERLAPRLAAETDERIVRQLIDLEHRAALASLANAMRKPG